MSAADFIRDLPRNLLSLAVVSAFVWAGVMIMGGFQ